jgi:predicted nucleotide-binding protein (sugar kinase/HSP70/actin superfamily)
MRVGIPHGLLYHKFGRLWKGQFQSRGIEVIASPETTADILADGIHHSISDLCLPVKAFFGHVCALKDSVDYLFIPRIIRMEPDAYMCPKFLGLPDMVRAAIRNLPHVIDTRMNIKEHNEDVFWQMVFSAFPGGKSLSALDASDLQPDETCLFQELKQIHYNNELTNNIKSNKITIGVAGRPYLVQDDHLNVGVVRFMRNMGLSVVIHNPEPPYIMETMSILPKGIYWSMGREIVSSVRWMLNDDRIDGIVLLAAAGCGPDSFMTELIKHTFDVRKKPYMNLNIDEHTSDTGIRTRVEAFVDMIERRAKKINHREHKDMNDIAS